MSTVPSPRPRVLMIDNYDSFTYNLVQLIESLGADVLTFRNDAITIDQARALKPSHIVISPGPGSPKESGISLDILQAFAGQLPVLGVCLGHQAMAEVFGGIVERAPRPMHGKASTIRHDSRGLYHTLPEQVTVGRYHSLAIRENALPKGFFITSQTDLGEIMGIRHEHWPMEGVQFHPESVLTPLGSVMLQNFLSPQFPIRH
jgi:anthranilate synthase/aminodeoxychorismate synthase-like glutamine amidotransferase